MMATDSLSVRIIGQTGKEGKGENQFAQPRGVCMDPETKEVFIVDCNNHRIQVYHLNSLAYIRQIGKGSQGHSPGALNYAVGICIDDMHQIFVADTNNHRIAVFNYATGGHIRTIGSHGTMHGCLSSPYGVCVDIHTQLLYVADYENHRVQVFEKETGAYVRTIGSGKGSEPGQMNQPIVVCLDSDNDYLLVADYSNNRVQVFHKDTGEHLFCVGSEAGPDAFNGPRGLCIDRHSNLLFISDRENHRIQIYNRNTFQLIRHLGGGMGVNPGQFQRPMELCVSAEDGVLLVVDGYNHRVQVLEVPELQAEKEKIRAAAKTKQEADLKGSRTPRPSLQAVLTPFSAKQPIVRDSSCGEALIQFPELGTLFEVVVPSADVELLDSFVASLSPQTEGDCLCSEGDREKELVGIESDSETKIVVEGVGSSSPSPYQQVLDQQARMFLSILESLAQGQEQSLDENGPSASFFAAPALIALSSLVDRQWRPDHMSARVVNFLVGFLGDLEANSTSPAERQRSTEAFVKTLRASVGIGADVAEMVLGALTAALRKRAVYSVSPTDVYPQTNSTNTNFNTLMANPREQAGEAPLSKQQEREVSEVTGTTHPRTEKVSVLMAYLDVVSFILDSETRSATGKNLDLSSGGQSEVLRGAGKDSHSLRQETLDFVFGPAFVSAVNRFQVLTHHSGVQTGRAPLPPLITLTPQQAPAHNASSGHLDTLTVPQELPETLDAMFRLNRERTRQPLYSPLVGDLQLGFLESFERLFTGLRKEETQQGVLGYERKSRGGRNVWRPLEPLRVGDLIDAMDKEKCWFESLVQEILVDGCVKVHFMGWGSKWDDTIVPSELSTRIAPLNSRTSNWRADLFEGGLIEIKCNDDVVNQKWMWGKVTALDVQQAWVEVSYSFSNEPTVVKRAWLFGETICPVGMHTKDKSKSAAAALVKPLKKVEDIIREKSEESVRRSEAVFLDPADEFDEDLHDPPLAIPVDTRQPQAPPEALPSSDSPAVSSEVGAKRAKVTSATTGSGDSWVPACLNSVDNIASTVLQSVMRELVRIVNDSINTSDADGPNEDDELTKPRVESQNQQRLDIAIRLLSAIAGSPFKRLLAPFFTKVLTFQCGIRAKVISGGFLAQRLKEKLFDLSRDFHPIMLLLNHLRSMAEQYVEVMVRSLGAGLSWDTLQQLGARVRSTIDRCGVTQIANDLLDFILRHPHVRNEVLLQFTRAGRFGERSTELRKVLSYLFKAASKRALVNFREAFESCLFTDDLDRVEFHWRAEKSTAVEARSRAFGLVQQLTGLLDAVQSVCRLEMAPLPHCHMAAQRALQREFERLPRESVLQFVRALAVALNAVLDGTNALVQSDQRMEALEKMLEIQKIAIDEESWLEFRRVFEHQMSHRLIRGRGASLSEERWVLARLPLMEGAERMLGDAAGWGSSSHYAADFSRHLLSRLDEGELEYCPAIAMGLTEERMVVRVIGPGMWPCVKAVDPFTSLRLPPALDLLSTEFALFYKTTSVAPSTSLDLTLRGTEEEGDSRRILRWCLGLGQVTIACTTGGGSAVDITLNEVQAAVLLLYNEDNSAKKVAQLCRDTDLSLQAMRAALLSLGEGGGEVPLFYWNDKLISMDTIVNLSPAFVSLVLRSQWVSPEPQHHSQLCFEDAFSWTHCMASGDQRALEDWRREKMDAAVMRVLKQAARTDHREVFPETGSERPPGVLSPEELSTRALEVLCQSVSSGCFDSEVTKRCDFLAAMGYIDKVQWRESLVRRQGYCYLFVPLKANVSPPVELLTGLPLFTQMCSTLPLEAGDPQTPEAEDEEKKGTTSLERCAEGTLSQTHFSRALAAWVAALPLIPTTEWSQLQLTSSPMQPHNVEDTTEEERRREERRFSDLQLHSPVGDSPSRTHHRSSESKSNGATLDSPARPVSPVVRGPSRRISPAIHANTLRELEKLSVTVHWTLATLVQQLNRLTHQHAAQFERCKSDSSLPPAPSLTRFLTGAGEVLRSTGPEEAFEILRLLFCSLPAALKTTVLRHFQYLVEHPSMATHKRDCFDHTVFECKSSPDSDSRMSSERTDESRRAWTRKWSIPLSRLDCTRRTGTEAFERLLGFLDSLSSGSRELPSRPSTGSLSSLVAESPSRLAANQGMAPTPTREPEQQSLELSLCEFVSVALVLQSSSSIAHWEGLSELKSVEAESDPLISFHLGVPNTGIPASPAQSPVRAFQIGSASPSPSTGLFTASKSLTGRSGSSGGSGKHGKRRNRPTVKPIGTFPIFSSPGTLPPLVISMAPENALAVRAVVTARNNIVASLDGGSNVGVSDPAGEQSKLEEAAEEASGKPISGRQSCKIRRFDSSFPQVPFAQLHALVAQQKTLQQSKSGGPPTDTRHLGSQKSILCSTPLTADKWKAAPEDEDIYISRTDKTSLQHVLDTLITRIQVQLTNIFPIGQQEVLPRTTLVPQDDNTPPDPQALDARSQEHRGHEIEERDAESKETAASTNSTDSGVGRESQMVGEGKLDGTEESSISRGVTQTKESQRAGESEDDVERETNVERRCVVDQYSLISVLLDSATRRIASTLSSSATERTERDQSLGLWWLDRSSSLWVGSPSEIPSTGAGVEQRVLGLQRLISGAFCQLDVNQDSLLTSADFSLPRMEDRSSAVGTGKVALGKGLDETEDSEQDLRLSRSLAFDPLPSQGGGFTQNFSELTAAVQELCGLDSRLHSSSLLSLCHWDRYRLYEACWAQDTSVGGGGSVRGWLAQQGHRSFIQMGDVVRRRKSSVKTKLDPILSSEMTLCGVCGKPSRLEDLFALRCRHYACSVCWRVQLKLMETKGETRVPCAAILRTRGEDRAVAAPCLATGDLDFVLRLSGEETTKKLHKERMSTYETEFHSIVSHDFNQRKQVPFVYPPGLLEHVHCRLCTDSRSGWNETEQDVGGSDTGKNLAGLDLRLTPTELSLDYTDSSTGTASAGDRVLTHFMERASRLLEKRESQDSAPLEEEELNTINTRFHLDNHHAEIRQFVQPKLEECRRLMLTAATDTHFWSMQHRVKLWRLILAGTYVYDHAGLDHLPIHPCSRHLLTLLRDQVTSVSARLTGKTGGPDSISTVEARRLQSALRGLITRVQEVWGTRPVKAFPFFSQSEDRGDSGHQSLVRHTPATGRQVIQGNTPCQSLYTADTIEFPDFLGFGVNPLIDVTARTLLRENSTNMIARADAPGEESLVARDCHALVDLLRGYPQLPAASVVSTLSSLHSLLSTTVAGVRHTGELAQTGLCPLLLAVLRHHVSSLEVCLEVCKLTQRLTDFNPVNCTLFIEADLWSVLPPVVQRHAGQFTGRSSVCVRCCKIMAHVLSSNDSNKRLSMRQLEVQPVFPALLRVLESEADEEDPSVCLSAIQATVCALDKDFTADSAFLRHGVCEVLLCRMMAHQEVEGMKVQFAIAVGRLASSNRFMQERLLELEVLEFLASLLLQHSGAEDAKLVKWCCWAVGCLVSFFPAGQTRFAALGGCKGICYAIQSTNDLNALTYVLRAMSSLALQNQYVQQCFEREETVAVLGEKRRHLQRLAQQAASYDFRSRLNLLLLTYDYALDSVGLLGQGEPGTGLFGDAGLLSADHE